MISFIVDLDLPRASGDLICEYMFGDGVGRESGIRRITRALNWLEESGYIIRDLSPGSPWYELRPDTIYCDCDCLDVVPIEEPCPDCSGLRVRMIDKKLVVG